MSDNTIHRPRVTAAMQETNARFLNMFTLTCEQRDGSQIKYSVASRAKSINELMAFSGKIKADAVVICATNTDETTGEKRLVMLNQYRYPLARSIYELPAGLLEGDELVFRGAIREMFEETGMQFTIESDSNEARPCFSSPGMTDESVSILFGTCTGTPTNSNQEASEDIQVVLADVDECKRILREELYDIRAFWAMKLFIAQNS